MSGGSGVRALRAAGLAVFAACALCVCGCNLVDFFPEDGARRDRNETADVRLSGQVGDAGRDATLRHRAFAAAIPAGSSFNYSFGEEKTELLKTARKLPGAVYAGCGALLVLGLGVGFLSRTGFGIRLGAALAGGGVLAFGVFFAMTAYPWAAVALAAIGILAPAAYFIWNHDPKGNA